MEPVRAPNPVKALSESLKHVLTQSVPLACPEGGVLGGPIALNGRGLAGPGAALTEVWVTPPG
jgi:hypothetical protein